ncbi:hypothetical protein ACJX0J_006199 [Zea mays]
MYAKSGMVQEAKEIQGYGLAELALQKLIELEPEDAGNYGSSMVFLSDDIYEETAMFIVSKSYMHIRRAHDYTKGSDIFLTSETNENAMNLKDFKNLTPEIVCFDICADLIKGTLNHLICALFLCNHV